MSKRKTRKKSTSQTLFWLLSLIMVASMVISLVIVALEPSPRPTPTPTWTPTPRPSLTPTSSPTLEPTAAVQPTAAVEATAAVKPTAGEPAVGPELPTATPTAEPTPAGAGRALPTTVALAARPSPTAMGRELPAPLEEPAATPFLTAVAEIRFAVCGDSRDGPQTYRRVLEMVTADQAEFLINTGDLVSEATEAQWSDFEALMAGFALPFYPVPGNHDALEGELDGYLAHSGAPAAHYSFDRGPIHFSLADSHDGGVTAAELDWLRQDLSATTQPLKIVVIHHPPFDPDGSDHIMAFGNEEFMALMSELDVDYVFAGHIHAYTRGERDGVEYVITGGAGAPLYSSGHPQAVNHYLLVTVQGGDVTVELVEV